MADNRIAVARYRSPIEAGLARARLASVGIEGFLVNDSGAAHPDQFDGMAVQLEVERADARGALEALQQGLGEQAESSGPEPIGELERCPVCESSFIQIRERSVLGRIFRALLTSFVPIPSAALESKSRACGVCGHSWKSRPEALGEPLPPGGGPSGRAP
ncbi:MAG: hypothetical protein V3V67_02260 [Myxococcota bacterium]